VLQVYVFQVLVLIFCSYSFSVFESVVGTSLEQNGFNKEIQKDKAHETIGNTYEDLSIEIPKAQTL